jgi:large subunit ribosomal protein L32e
LEYQANKYNRIAGAVSSRKRVDILAKAKALGVKVTNAKGRVTTES